MITRALHHPPSNKKKMEPEVNNDTNLNDYIENELKKNRPYPKKFDIAVPANTYWWGFFKNKLNTSAVTTAVKMLRKNPVAFPQPLISRPPLEFTDTFGAHNNF